MKLIHPTTAAGLFTFLTLLALVIYKTDSLTKIQNVFFAPPPPAELSQSFHNKVELQKRVDKNLPENSILFIGDSHIEGLEVTTVHSKGVNFGIGNDTTKGVLFRIPQYTSIHKCKAMIAGLAELGIMETGK